MNTTTENTCPATKCHTEVMDFAAFVAKMQKLLQQEYPGCEVRIVHADKNNGIRKTGISIRHKDKNTAPNLYMEQYYEAYLEGRPAEQLAADAVRLHEACMPGVDIPLPNMTDFDTVKDLICCKLVNRERNSERLKKMPHRPFLDLAVTYYIPVDVTEDCGGSIAVTNQLLQMWHTDEKTLYRCAVANMERLCPANLRSMEEVIMELCGEEAGLQDASGKADHLPSVPFYVLRCGNGEHAGAAAMLCDSVLKEFAKKYGSFYILPSSIFEVLLLPGGTEPADAAYVCRMVREVNRTQLSPEEVLSDNAYFYHADTGEIEILS